MVSKIKMVSVQKYPKIAENSISEGLKEGLVGNISTNIDIVKINIHKQ